MTVTAMRDDELGSRAARQGFRNRAGDRRGGGHENRTQPYRAGIQERFCERKDRLFAPLVSKVHQQESNFSSQFRPAESVRCRYRDSSSGAWRKAKEGSRKTERKRQENAHGMNEAVELRRQYHVGDEDSKDKCKK